VVSQAQQCGTLSTLCSYICTTKFLGFCWLFQSKTITKYHIAMPVKDGFSTLIKICYCWHYFVAKYIVIWWQQQKKGLKGAGYGKKNVWSKLIQETEFLGMQWRKHPTKEKERKQKNVLDEIHFALRTSNRPSFIPINYKGLHFT